MLTLQDDVGDQLRAGAKIRRAATLLMELPRPNTPSELIDLMEKLEKSLTGEE
jgi:hypothetical protein